MKITTYPFTASAAQSKRPQAILTGQKRPFHMIVHLNYDLSRLNPFVNLVQSSAKTKDLFKIHEALNKVVFNQTVLVPQRLVILKQKAAGTQTQRKKKC